MQVSPARSALAAAVKTKCWLRALAQRFIQLYALFFALLLTACGGDDDANYPDAAQLTAAEPGAPAASGDVAADGLTWINYRRAQAGLPQLRRDARLDAAASAHADYQQLNDVVSHEQQPGKPGFVAPTATERVRVSGFPLLTTSFADGEVIAATGASDGFAAAEGLLGAIYHRYLVLEPVFNLAGTGSAWHHGSFHWLTVNMVALRGSSGLSGTALVVWPRPSQQQVRTNFFSDQETPDPVPRADEVGYPVSVHANLNAVLHIDSFTLSDPEGRDVAVRQLDAAADRDTPPSAAAIIPLAPLRSGATYHARFVGRVGEQPIERSWRFTTR